MFLENKNIKPLDKILDSHLAPMGINRLIIAYSKQKSLRNLLFPRTFDRTEGPPASDYLQMTDK